MQHPSLSTHSDSVITGGRLNERANALLDRVDFLLNRPHNNSAYLIASNLQPH